MSTINTAVGKGNIFTEIGVEKNISAENIFSSADNQELLTKNTPKKRYSPHLTTDQGFVAFDHITDPEAACFASNEFNPEFMLVLKEAATPEDEIEEEVFEITAPGVEVPFPPVDSYIIETVRPKEKEVIVHKIPQTFGFGRIKAAARR